MTTGQLSGRFTFIDGLRGLAAFWVLCFHFYSQILESGMRPQFIEPLHTLLVRGDLGVEIFFVLSGFVIAHSVHGVRVTGSYLGRFALRRSLRLDPPYWLVIFMTYAVLRLGSALGESHSSVPDALGIVANMLYLDNLLGLPSLVKVGWTLCLEVQFYITYIILIAATQRLAPDAWKRHTRAVVFGPLFLYALAIQLGVLPLPHRGLFVEYWAMFFLGAITWWTLANELSARSWAVCTLVAIIGAFVAPDVRLGIAWMTAVAIFVAGRTQRLGHLLRGPVLQYLGRISYSLYLVHPLVGHRLIRLASRRFGFSGALGGAQLFVIALVAALVTAHLLHVLVERPALRFSHQLRRDRSAGRVA